MIDLIFSIIVWGTVAGNLVLGLLVFAKNQRNLINASMAVLAFINIFWSVGLFFFQHPVFLSSLIWLKAVYVAVVFLMGSILFFSFLFPLNLAGRLKSFIFPALFCLIPGIFFIWTIIYTNLFVSDVVFESAGPREILGPVFLLFTIWAIYCSVWSTFNFFRSYKNADGLRRLQLKYLFVGMILFSVVPITLDVVFPLVFGNSHYIWLSPISGIFFIGFTSYAIIVHRLLDIRFVVARTVAYFLLVFIISVFYAAAAFALGSLFLGFMVNQDQIIIYTFLTILIALSFQRLREELEKFTDRIFFRGRYNGDELLSRIGSIMSANIELGSLTNQILQILIAQMRLTKGALVILGEGVTAIYDITEIGFTRNLVLSYQQIAKFFPSSEIIVSDELDDSNHLKNVMRQLDINVVKNLMVKDEVVGVLLLGEKSSGEAYSVQDLKVLEILTKGIAVAIKNAQGYDKIKKFNIILSQEIKKATADLQDANERLKITDKLKDDFVSIASHELRTPMAAIRSYAWMVLHRSDIPLSPILEKYITRILLSTERLINLVNDMLNVARIESNRIEIHPEPVDVISLIRDIIDEVYYSKSEDKKIQFIVSNQFVPKVYADPEKLRQVFLSLVGNSLKFTPNEGKISFDFFSDGKTVEISVSDTGVGILQEDFNKLFHKFERLDNSFTSSASLGGTGLGLYISKNLVELMRGKIWAKSEGINKGSTFVVSLPIVTPDILSKTEIYTADYQPKAKGLETTILN